MKKLLTSILAGFAVLAASASLAFASPPPLTGDNVPYFPTAQSGIAWLYQFERNDPTKWTYVGASAITSTTGVTLKTAVTGKKIYLKGLQVINSGSGTNGEFNINCGASGTSMYHGWVPASNGWHFSFPQPLECTAGTLVEIKFVTATSINVLVNAQGYTDN